MKRNNKQIKAQAEQYLNEKHRLRDENGRIIIDMTVNDDSNFLSPFSGRSAPVISEDVAQFMENSTFSVPPREELVLRIHSNCIDYEEKKNYSVGIKEYYAEKYITAKKELRINRMIIAVLLLAGILTLAISFQIENHIWAEVIDIAAWVFLWEAVDIGAFQNKNLRRRRTRYLRYMVMDIEFLELN